MDHTDWIGISVLISTITTSVVSIIATIQSLRNHKAIKEVESRVNGVVEQAVTEAHKSGVLEGQAAEFRKWMEDQKRRPK